MMMFLAALLGGATGYLAERATLVRNGYVVSVALGVGGAVILWFVQYLLGFGLGFGFDLGIGRAMTSILGAVAMLLLARLRR